MSAPDVKRELPPAADNGIELYCDDSPKRPGYEAQLGDEDNLLIFPLHDGLQLRLHCGRETFAHFVAMLAARAADDADDELEAGHASHS